MFTELGPKRGHTVSISFNGVNHTVTAGITVAAALLLIGVTHFRETHNEKAPRSAFCMMGVCFDCLCIIDGEPNRQTCITIVHQGMTIVRQLGAAELNLHGHVE
jgi:succinate dehydrogenase/fumarate reductase-like Fe-S protein